MQRCSLQSSVRGEKGSVMFDLCQLPCGKLTKTLHIKLRNIPVGGSFTQSGNNRSICKNRPLLNSSSTGKGSKVGGCSADLWCSSLENFCWFYLVLKWPRKKSNTSNLNLGHLGMISLINHHSQWGRSEVVIIYPEQHVVKKQHQRIKFTL